MSSNLNRVLKSIKFIFNFKNKIKIKIFHVTERYHFYDGVHHAQIKRLFEKSSSYFTKRFISTKKMSRKNLAWKDFRNGMKEKRNGGKQILLRI